jgi:hypothetical protein
MGVVPFPLGPEGAPELLAFAGLALQAGVLLAKLGRLGLGIVARLLELDDDRLEVRDWDGDIDVIRGGLGWIRAGKQTYQPPRGLRCSLPSWHGRQPGHQRFSFCASRRRR